MGTPLNSNVPEGHSVKYHRKNTVWARTEDILFINMSQLEPPANWPNLSVYKAQ